MVKLADQDAHFSSSRLIHEMIDVLKIVFKNHKVFRVRLKSMHAFQVECGISVFRDKLKKKTEFPCQYDFVQNSKTSQSRRDSLTFLLEDKLSAAIREIMIIGDVCVS